MQTNAKANGDPAFTIGPINQATAYNFAVHELPPDSCTVSFTKSADPLHPNQIHFTAISNQTITSQTWYIYQWGSQFNTVTLTTNNPTYTFTDTGYYIACVYITTNTGCASHSCWGFSMNELTRREAGRVTSYPNPASNTVSFWLQLSENEKINVIVYNLSGYAVYRMQQDGIWGSNKITIPVQRLNSGQYFIDIQYGKQRKRSIFQKL